MPWFTGFNYYKQHLVLEREPDEKLLQNTPNLIHNWLLHMKKKLSRLVKVDGYLKDNNFTLLDSSITHLDGGMKYYLSLKMNNEKYFIHITLTLETPASNDTLYLRNVYWELKLMSHPELELIRVKRLKFPIEKLYDTSWVLDYMEYLITDQFEPDTPQPTKVADFVKKVSAEGEEEGV